MKTVDIKGKAYVQVNERIIYFRDNFKGWRLSTEIVSLIEGVVTMKALIHNPVGELIATGYAQEKEGSGFINKTSFIENCETSAWGRALGNLGIGVETSIASSEEVETAILNQDKKPVKKVVNPVEEYSSLGKMSEKEAHDQATEIGLNGIMSSLNKSENIAYQDEVIKNTLVICGFDKWDNIRFDKKISYEKFLSIIKQELEKEKALATAGI